MLDPLLEAHIREWRKAPAYLVALLEALQFHGSNLERMHRLDATQWNELLSFSDRAHLTLQLSQLPSDIFPAWVASRIQQNLADNTVRIRRIKGVYQEAAEAFSRNNAEHVVLKGFAQYPDYVKNLNLRMQSDIDVYCPPNTILDALEALQQIGYTAKPPHARHVPVDHFPAMTRERGWQWRGNVFDPEMPAGIELHYCLWNQDSAHFGIPEVEDFWHRREERDVDGFRFFALNPVDHIGFCCLHVLRDLIRGDWVIHHVHELAYLLQAHAKDAALWRRWKETHSDSLRSLEAVSFCLARLWFGCSAPEEVKEQIDGLAPPVQQWFHCFCSSSLKMMFTPNRDGAWLHVALLPSTGAKLSALRHGLLPAGIPPLTVADNTPSLERKIVRPKYSQRSARYAAYAISKAGFYGLVFFRGALGGFRWWRAQRNLKAPFWRFFAAASLWSLGLSIFFFLFNLFLLGRGFSEKLIGGFSSTMACGSMAATIPIGWLASRFGLRKILLCGFILTACIFALRALLLGEPAQWTLAFLAGAALSVWAVCISPALAQLTTEANRSFGFSLVFSSGVGMVAVGNLIGGHLAGWLRALPSWGARMPPDQGALLIACAIAAAGFLLLAQVKFDQAPEIQAPGYTEKRLPSRFLFRFLPAVALWGLAIGAFNPFATIYFTRRLNMPLTRLGLVFSVAQVFQFLGILIAPALFRKSGRVAGIVYTEIAASVALITLAAVRQPATAGILYIAYTTVQWMGEPGIYSMLMDKVPAAERSGAAAWNALTLSAAQTVATFGAGAAIVRFGYTAVLSAAAGIALLAACSFKVLLTARDSDTCSKELTPAESGSVAS